MNQILDIIQLYKTGSILPGSTTPITSSIFTSGSIPELYFKNKLGDVYNLSSTSSYYNILEFTSSAQWLKPANVKYVRVIAVSAGGSGGGGAYGLVGGTVTGGTGGAGGGYIQEFFSSASLPDGIYNITIGVGGTPTGGRTTPGIGSTGNQGTQTVFATGSTIILRPFSGNGGQNGNTSAVSELGGASDRGTVTPNTRWPVYRYGLPGATVSALTGRIVNQFDAAQTFFYWQYGPAGGGGLGGHISASGVFVNEHRATSGSTILYPYPTIINTCIPGTWGLGTNGQTIADVIPMLYITSYITGSLSTYTPRIYTTGGGAGGGAGDFAGTIGGGNGSDGGLGCGGGGGGATIGVRAGSSGRGGGGYLAIIEYY
jgi:hypothetical protein